jgi:hypothetical protein
VSVYIYEVAPTGDDYELQRVPLAKLGARRLPGWAHPRSSPARRWATIYPNGAYWVENRHWLDHLHRFRLQDGRTAFRSEPYGLTFVDLADLMFLREDGWEVEIGGPPSHHPATVVVSVERAADPSPRPSDRRGRDARPEADPGAGETPTT